MTNNLSVSLFIYSIHSSTSHSSSSFIIIPHPSTKDSSSTFYLFSLFSFFNLFLILVHWTSGIGLKDFFVTFPFTMGLYWSMSRSRSWEHLGIHCHLHRLPLATHHWVQSAGTSRDLHWSLFLLSHYSHVARTCSAFAFVPSSHRC